MEVVYGAHDFEAENQDEISFRPGERIIVLEKDDQYQDGWWQGENESGQRGLFPQNYTVKTKPALSEPPSPMTAQTGTFASSSSNGAGAPAASEQRGSLGLPVQDLTRKDSHGGGPEMRATINDIQNHLDEMHLSKAGGAPLGGAIAVGAQVEAVTGELGNGPMIPPPPHITRNQSIDETSSLASRSTRDDASSIRDQEGGFESQRTSIGTAMAPHAKENLARNIQLAQEREERQRMLEEQEREAERERMRLSNGPPVEGLVLTDESDIEEDSDDDDSIFPVRKRTSDDLTRDSRERNDVADNTRDSSPPPEEATPQVGGNQDGRFSPATEGPTTPPLPPATSSKTIIEQDDDSSYPTPAMEEPEAPLEKAPVTSPSSHTTSPQLAERRSIEPDREAAPILSVATVAGAAAAGTGAISMVRDGTAKPTQGDLRPSSQLKEGDYPRRASTDSEQFVVSKRDSPVDQSLPGSSAVLSAPQAARALPSGNRYPTDAAPGSGQDNLLAVVEQAQTQSPITVNAPRQSTASVASSIQPVSPYHSTASSSRPGSALETAFTPATSGGYEPSPRSATFPSRTPTLADPREWSIEEVIEWGQSRNFDNQVLGKFREHEISGDVLVDMDINTLKEIDILAFGPRARIARAIRELNAKYYGVPIVSPGASSHIGDLPSTPESSAAPQSAQSAQVAFYPANSADTSSQAYQQSPVSAQAPPVGGPAGAEHLRGLGLAEASPSQSSATASSSLAGSAAGSTTQSSTRKSDTSRTRDRTAGTDGSVETANNSQEAGGVAKDSKEASLHETPASIPANERRRQKSSIGSTMSGAFNRHNRQKSVAPSVADSNTGSMTDSGEKGKSGGRAFFASGLSRSRKPPPQYQVPEMETLATDKPAAMPRSVATAPSVNRLSTRFFTFGGGSAPNSPKSGQDGPRRNISAPLEATSPKSAISPVSPALEARGPHSASVGSTAGALHDEPMSYSTMAEAPKQVETPPKALTQAERIGQPDYSGWLRKKTEKYNGWKDRYLILKDSYLYVLKSPNEEKVKGYISLGGYRFVSDGTVGSGLSDKSKYGFKAIHDTLPTHYFSSSDSVTIRNWMKALMKATIGRDYSAPVTSSSNIKTIPLSVAQAMNPPPRPPSPNSAIRVQKASVKQNPNSLSHQDAAKLMGAQVITPSPSGMIRSGSHNGLAIEKNGSPVSPAKKKNSSLLPPLRSSQRKKPMPEPSTGIPRSTSSKTRLSLPDDNRRNSWYGTTSGRQSTPSPRQAIDTSGQQVLQPQAEGARLVDSSVPVNQSQETMDWINDQLPPDVKHAASWQDFCSGELYTRVVERVTGKPSGVSDAQFAKFTPLQPGRTPDMSYVDILFNCFDYLLDSGIKTDDVSINDLLTGNEPHLIKLAEVIRNHFS